MLSRFKKLGITASFLAGLALPIAVHAAEFNDVQKKEMGQIIRQYLLKNPEVLREAFQALEKKEKLAQLNQAQKAIVEKADIIFRSKGDLVMGNPNGKTTMVEFFDYNCGFCKRSLPDILRLAAEDKDLKIVLKEFPILGPGSMFAARAAIASKMQNKYLELHLAMIKKRGTVNEAAVLKAAQSIGLDMKKLQKDMKSDAVSKIIQENHSIARALNINGTPAFIIGDQLLPGAVGFETLSSTIKDVRENGTCKVC